jgi:hypothetical protein
LLSLAETTSCATVTTGINGKHANAIMPGTQRRMGISSRPDNWGEFARSEPHPRRANINTMAGGVITPLAEQLTR